LRIDSHHHLWVYRPEDHPWIGPTQAALKRDYLTEEFGEVLGSAGYSASVAVQARQSVEETRWLLRQAAGRPFLKGVVGWIDLRSPGLEEQLQELLPEPKLVGFRHNVHDESDDFLTRTDFRRGLGVLQRYGLAYDLLIFPRHLPLIESLANEFPGLTMVVDHLGKPMTEGTDLIAWKRNLGRLAAYPRICVKLSGLFSETVPCRWDTKSIEFLLDSSFEAFGPERVMAASNWPVSNLAGTYAWTMSLVENYVLKHHASAANLVLGENTARIYRLKLSETTRRPGSETRSGIPKA
jgi:L-fuconolactonase